MTGAPPTLRLVDVRVVRESVRALVDDLDPDAVFLHEAAGVWAEFDLVERMVASAKTLLARRVEAAGTWKQQGLRSAAEQLARVAGTSITSARSMLETSKRVEDFPATAAAMRQGALSAAQAQVIAAAVVVAPEAEDRLLELAADAPLAKITDECLRTKAAVDRDATHARIHAERYLREFPDAEGAWKLNARGTADKGAEFRVTFDPIVDEIFKTARAEGRKESRDAYAFDALLEMARRATGGGTATTTKRPRPSSLALIRVDHSALQRGSVEGDEICDIPGLGPIPVTVARDLLGDAVLKLVITKGVDVINVTHLGRSATIAQKVALWWQSPMCQALGCTHTQRLEIDHREGWAKTHVTEVDDLDRLCKHHHWLKTHEGWELVEGEGQQPMVPPTDPRHPNYRAPPEL